MYYSTVFFPKTKQFNCTVFCVSSLVLQQTNVLNRFSGAKIVYLYSLCFARCLYSTERTSVSELILFKIFRQSYLTTAFKIEDHRFPDKSQKGIEHLVLKFDRGFDKDILTKDDQ